MEQKRKPRVATVWLGGCSGCHMSFLDMDERLLELADRAEIVHSPVADVKTFPRDVDVVLVEGAVASEEHEELARVISRNARVVVSFGDCAVTGNVTALRNTIPLPQVLDRAYGDLSVGPPARPDDYSCIARLLPMARPLHEYITVDAFLHGCPPTADQIWHAVSALLGNPSRMKTLFALVESPFSPHFPDLYQALGIEAVLFDSARNLHRALQKQAPDFFVGEFVYGWGNDYAGNTVSNLDVTLRTLQSKAPKAKNIVVMQPSEAPHIGKLTALFPVHAVLKYPVSEDEMRAVLQAPA